MFLLLGTASHSSNVRKHMLNYLQPSVTHMTSTENILTSRGRNTLLTSRCELWLFLTHTEMTVTSSTLCMFLHFQNCEPHRNPTLTHDHAHSCRTLLLYLHILLLLLEQLAMHTGEFFSGEPLFSHGFCFTGSFLQRCYPFPKQSWSICVEGGIVWHFPILYTVGCE